MKNETMVLVRALAKAITDDETLGRLALRSGLIGESEIGWALRAAVCATVEAAPVEAAPVQAEPVEAAPVEAEQWRLEPLEHDSRSRIRALDRWCDHVASWLQTQPQGRWSGTAQQLVDAVPGYPASNLRAIGSRLGQAAASGATHGFRVVSREWRDSRWAVYALEVAQ